MKRPSGSTSDPSGTGLPPFEATSTLPSATSEVAKSSSSIGPLPSGGTPMQTGLVEKRRSTPPNGATSSPPSTLTKWSETRPASAARSAQSPMRPRWPEWRSPIIATPASRALAMPKSTASGPIVWPKP